VLHGVHAAPWGNGHLIDEFLLDGDVEPHAYCLRMFCHCLSDGGIAAFAGQWPGRSRDPARKPQRSGGRRPSTERVSTGLAIDARLT
jgi:hypothetical protein